MLWERHSYTQPLQKELRNMYGLVVTVPTFLHNDLHHELAPPPMPSHDLTCDLLNRQDRSHDQYEANLRITNFIGYMASKYSGEYQAENAYQIYRHLVEQRDILDLNNKELYYE